MEDSGLKECSYFLVRYVPDAVKEEFINIGLFLFCPAERFLDCLFSDNLRRVTRFHPQADAQFLRELQPHFEQQIEEHENDLSGFIREMQQSYSNLVQLSAPRTCLATDLGAQLQDLFERHVGARLVGPAKQDTRMRIRQQFVESLRRQGVFDHRLFEKRIAASQWTGAGDPFVFDFGYRPPVQGSKPGGGLKLIHMLSLERDNELAKALRWTFDKVLDKEPSRLTVGHEDILDPDNAIVRSSRGILEDDRIQLLPVSSFHEYAQTIRAELLM
jgi:hypothetical protein